MKTLKNSKAFLFSITLPLTVLAALFLLSKTNLAQAQFVDPYVLRDSQEQCEDGYLEGTYCPCPDVNGDGIADKEYASICGIVRDANIVAESEKNDIGQTIWSLRKPVGGVTVGIYELHDDIPTGLPWGRLGGDSSSTARKVGECTTTSEEGKYHCMVRRITPDNLAFMAFFCGGKKVHLKTVPTNESFVNYDVEVDCSGEQSPSPAPDTIDIAERERYLGCSIQETSPAVGFGDTKAEGEVIHEFANLGVLGGDIRFGVVPEVKFEVFGVPMFNVLEHDGAYWSRDCAVKFNPDPEDNLDGITYKSAVGEDYGGLIKEWFDNPLADIRFLFNQEVKEFSTVEEKCNINNALADKWRLTHPFRYSLPVSQDTVTYRSIEPRFSVQREMQNPRAFAQATHVLYGDCIGEVFLRYYGDNTEDEPIPCDEMLKCSESLGSNKNAYTATSFGSSLASIGDFVEMWESGERDPEDIVCKDPELGEVKISEVQPPIPDDPCIPGEPGCKYKIKNIPPIFFAFAGGAGEGSGSVEKEWSGRVYNDTYETSERGSEWRNYASEAQNPHKSGHKVIYSDDSVAKNNSGVLAMRVASDEFSGESTTGIMANRFVNLVDATEKNYDYGAEREVGYIGEDVRSMCTLSAANGIVDSTVTKDNEGSFLRNNVFIGEKEDHRTSEFASTATYSTSEAQETDKYLNEGALFGEEYLYDHWDSVLRLASGEGELSLEPANLDFGFWNLVGQISGWIGNSARRKSFGERVPAEKWSKDKDSILETEFCMTEEGFYGEFEPYIEGVNNRYPGNVGSCYPWSPLERGEYCNVWPGPEFEGTTEEFNGQLRTCRIDQCARFRLTRTCDESTCVEYDCWEIPPLFPDVPDCDPGPCGEGYCYLGCKREACGDGNGDGVVDSKVSIDRVSCRPQDETECLKEQKDDWRPSPAELRKEYPPPALSGPNYNPTSTTTGPFCDLSRAGPMQPPGDIRKEHAARVNQEPINSEIEDQVNADPINSVTNYTAAAWIPLSESMRETNDEVKALVDYAVTENLDRNSTDNLTQKHTAGALTKGVGTGASQKLRAPIARNEGPTFLTEPFPEFEWSADCTPGAESEWCVPTTPPDPIDLNAFNGGACTPNIAGASCPLQGMVGPLALEILGAAGQNAGDVPGSLMLALIVGESGWLYDSDGVRDTYEDPSTWFMSWDNESIASYSEPYYKRIPHCDERNYNAQGPFGITSYDTSNTFENAVLADGYHPSRGDSPEDALEIVSKCNFIDAAYASAQILTGSGNCSSITRQQARNAIASYWGGDHTASDIPDFLVDIAVNCQ